MSVIFDAMLILELSDREAIDALNRALYFKDTERHQQFGKVDMDKGGAGGSKSFTTNVYAAAFNHFIPDDVEECVREAPWRYPQTVFYIRELGGYSYGGEDEGLTMRSVEQMRQEATTDAT